MAGLFSLVLAASITMTSPAMAQAQAPSRSPNQCALVFGHQPQQQPHSQPQPNARKALTASRNFNGAAFLHQKNSELHQTGAVEATVKSARRRTQLELVQPQEKLTAWLDARENLRLTPQTKEKIKESIANRYVIKTGDVPESYFALQVKIARELGHGTINLNTETRAQLAQTAARDQRISLETWVDYFLHDDANVYPMWIKQWAFTNVVKLGPFDPATGEYGTRSTKFVAPFAELNREAFAYVVDVMTKKVNGHDLSKLDIKTIELLKNANFGKLYAYAIARAAGENRDLTVTTGNWVKYARGGEPDALVNSLQGMNTGWCTAGETTARTQLEDGDFYVYYSHDKNGRAIVPRLAIRMSGSQIGEVRGIANSQNLDPHIAETPILSDKLKEFGAEGSAYLKQSSDMKRLTDLDKRNQAGDEISVSDLKFLYEIDSKIEGFGYKRDPRIDEIKATRPVHADLARIFNLKDSEVSVTELRENGWTSSAGFQEGIKLHFGNLGPLPRFKSPKYDSLPETVIGNAEISVGSASRPGIPLPRLIKGNLKLSTSQYVKGQLKLPETVTRDLELRGVESMSQVVMPKVVGGRIAIPELTSVAGLELPENWSGSLELAAVESVQGLTLPRKMSRLYLPELKTTDGLILPLTVTGELHLGLTSAVGLRLPTRIEGPLNLTLVESPVGLELPDYVGGALYLGSLRSARGLRLPKTVGTVYLHNAKDAAGLMLPKTLAKGATLHFGSGEYKSIAAALKAHPEFVPYSPR